MVVKLIFPVLTLPVDVDIPLNQGSCLLSRSEYPGLKDIPSLVAILGNNVFYAYKISSFHLSFLGRYRHSAEPRLPGSRLNQDPQGLLPVAERQGRRGGGQRADVTENY
jgi:hypothetical protein